MTLYEPGRPIRAIQIERTIVKMDDEGVVHLGEDVALRLRPRAITHCIDTSL